jgi:hypothetical protein
LTGRRQPDLADRLALALLEHGPLPCERLARTIEARTADVRRELRADSRFEHAGAGRGSRWRLVLPPSGSRDGLGRNLSPGSGSDDGPTTAARLDALERRVAELERQRAHSERAGPEEHGGRAPLAGQLTVEQALANGDAPV